MRILLVQHTPYTFTAGGAGKANRKIVEALASRGHVCKVIVPSLTMHDRGFAAEVNNALRVRASEGLRDANGVYRYLFDGVHVDIVTELSSKDRIQNRRLRSYLADEACCFAPDWILVASEDPYQMLLETALSCGKKVAYIARSTSMLGFGPYSFFPRKEATEFLKNTSLVLANSQYLRRYISHWSGVDSLVVDYPIYEVGDCQADTRWTTGEITIINPCAIKGIDIFVALACRMPSLKFCYVPSWGTTVEDAGILESLPNVSKLSATNDVFRLFGQTSILIVPSLWDEAFGRVVVEAMSQGIPVVSSNTGGLPEAKLGVDFVIPVNQITGYTGRYDRNLIPVPIVPSQDLTVWQEALLKLTGDHTYYCDLACQSYETARSYVSGLSFDTLENALLTRLKELR